MPWWRNCEFLHRVQMFELSPRTQAWQFKGQPQSLPAHACTHSVSGEQRRSDDAVATADSYSSLPQTVSGAHTVSFAALQSATMYSVALQVAQALHTVFESGRHGTVWMLPAGHTEHVRQTVLLVVEHGDA
jgi:hypothetical protein